MTRRRKRKKKAPFRPNDNGRGGRARIFLVRHDETDRHESVAELLRELKGLGISEATITRIDIRPARELTRVVEEAAREELQKDIPESREAPSPARRAAVLAAIGTVLLTLSKDMWKVAVEWVRKILGVG